MRYNWFKVPDGELAFSKVLTRGVAVDNILREIVGLRRGVNIMIKQLGHRLPSLLACLALFTGCSIVHQRQSLYPNGAQRQAEVPRGFGRLGKTRAPLINLRVEPESPGTTTVEGNMRTTRGCPAN